MRRLTIEEVKQAYASTGLKPKRGVTVSRDCACPIGALYVQYVGRELVGMFTTIGVAALSLGLHFKYAMGFAEGFDRPDLALEGSTPEFNAGLSDGKEVSAAIMSSP